MLARRLGLPGVPAVRFAPVSTAQVLFSVALAFMTVLITVFGIYVAGSTLWGNRWYRKGR